MQLDSTDLAYLRRFSCTPDGQQWLKLLQRNQTETDVRLRTAIGDDLLRTQGKAQLLAELISQVTEAEKKLDRARPARPVVAGAGWSAG